MMKHFGTLILGFTLIAGLSSCNKCQVCEARDADNVVRYEYEQVCGKSKDLQEYASKCESEYGQYDGYSCVCKEIN